MQLAICFVFIALRRTRGYNQKKAKQPQSKSTPHHGGHINMA